MKKLLRITLPTAFAIVALCATLSPAMPRLGAFEREHEEEEEDEAIERVMKVCNKAPKGTPTLAEKVIDGSATEEETKKLIASYRTLKGTKPEKGDLADWNKRVEALLAAVDGIEKKEPGAADKFEDANSCKSCHNAHKKKGR